MGELDIFIQRLAILLLPALFAITVHEAAHGWMAGKLGDNTAKMLGRITLNPIKHIDPVGTIAVPLVTYFILGFPFGWAKPVPVNGRNLKNPMRDMAIVALAGPGANLLMAIAWGLVVLLGVWIMPSSEWIGLPLTLMAASGVVFNCILMVLNLTPILPLDGGRVVAGFLPPRQALIYSRLEPYGLFILVGLLATGILGKLLWPIVMVVIALLPGSDVVLELFQHLMR
ncbi:FIG004556: membrane metalloprotease [hydrothermal vent metagenome]|uniref:FIG004556: membrane metalloprotease n=1 Tax=hydrothermal vent metagenome TaxID=652676 RepID=A0A3B1AJ99_9ZZZZ